jgi:hypothetical protein
MKKITVKTDNSLWIDEELRNCMVERAEARLMANKSGFTTDWQKHGKLRNHVTKLNKNKKKLYFETKINYVINDSKKLCSTLNEIWGKPSSTSH